MSTEDSLLDLCSICHINPPKYRCPRCATRTCSLACSRRHKDWSQCSGVRDPAAFQPRKELATESAFDRDFNYLTSIERSLERAERDVENRGMGRPSGAGAVVDAAAVGLDHELGAGESVTPGERKRKRTGDTGGGGLIKGEAGFLRGADTAGVKVVRAPRGMSRNKANGTKWHPKHKCLSWTVEWIAPDGERRNRSSLESCTVEEAYDRAFPLPREGREQKTRGEPDQTQTQAETNTPDTSTPAAPSTEEALPSTPSTDTVPPKEPSTPADQTTITPHRNLYFYLHRPRTATKQPVLIPLAPQTTLTAALRNRTVLEFPTIYILPDSPETLRERESPTFLLEEVYLQSQPQAETEPVLDGDEDALDDEVTPLPGAVDITNVDENKVLEVLKKDLFEPVSADTP